MAAMVVWLAVLGVLCATLPLSAAIELSRLYEHMEGVRFKRSGKLTQAGTHSFSMLKVAVHQLPIYIV